MVELVVVDEQFGLWLVIQVENIQVDFQQVVFICLEQFVVGIIFNGILQFFGVVCVWCFVCVFENVVNFVVDQWYIVCVLVIGFCCEQVDKMSFVDDGIVFVIVFYVDVIYVDLMVYMIFYVCFGDNDWGGFVQEGFDCRCQYCWFGVFVQDVMIWIVQNIMAGICVYGGYVIGYGVIIFDIEVIDMVVQESEMVVVDLVQEFKCFSYFFWRGVVFGCFQVCDCFVYLGLYVCLVFDCDMDIIKCFGDVINQGLLGEFIKWW